MSALIRNSTLILRAIVVAVLLLCAAPNSFAQHSDSKAANLAATASAAIHDGLDAVTSLQSGSEDEEQSGTESPAKNASPRSATAVEIAVLLTVLSLLPAILVTITSFTRIIIVLSFVRRALGINELPPNPVLIGLALFLTSFVMAPVANRVYESAWKPYKAGTLDMEGAGDKAWVEMRGFLLANTRKSELDLFSDMAKLPAPASAAADDNVPDLPMRVVVPAFVLSELKTAFQMGFLLFLPFLVIDLVVSSVLLSMGMFMLPPVMISTPFKILLFVLVDGWHLVCQSLVTSFVTT
jgi:flagellar biosynthetic protein FliP